MFQKILKIFGFKKALSADEILRYPKPFYGRFQATDADLDTTFCQSGGGHYSPLHEEPANLNEIEWDVIPQCAEVPPL